MAHILVIGGAGGLGLAVVEQLLSRGDNVSISVLNDAEEATARARVPGVSSILHLDLSDAETAGTTLARALESLPSVQAVIVCAAIAPLGPMETTPLAVVRRALEVNCVSHVALYQAALPALRQTGGRIIFVSSMAGFASMPFIGAYSASKFALEGATDAMRREAAPQGVNVILVQPGGIRTPMVDNQLIEVKERLSALNSGERDLYGYLYQAFDVMARKSHYEDASTPEQIADTVIGALDAESPRARYIAGADAEQMAGLASQDDAAVDAAFAAIYAQASAAQA